MSRRRPIGLLMTAILFVCAGVALAVRPTMFRGSQRSVVVYCAHDAIFAESILRDFERKTGIKVDVQYDSEATKSLGLINRLQLEKNQPRCDVFWNNELLGTMDLARDGLLEGYQGPGWQRIPPQYRDDDGRWAGFAARVRVWIVNTKNVKDVGKKIDHAFTDHVSRTAIAKPLYGTTLTHYSVLWWLWGPDRLKRWHAGLRQRGLQQLAGNARVKDAVAAGVCDVGWTDTDDYFEAVDDQQPVDFRPVVIPRSEVRLLNGRDLRGGDRTIAIPNTVSIVHGTSHRGESQELVDFLLSANTELVLARSKSRQIPLGRVDSQLLPPEVRALVPYIAQGFDLRELESAHHDCLEWLKSESQ